MSVVFAWLAGRDANGPSGEFPPLTKCGLVDPLYVTEMRGDSYDYDALENIPVSLNEPWRGGLPIWLMSLGPTAVGIAVFLILRDEFQSRRWGTLKAADSSAHWMSWLFTFTILGIVNSLAGAITAAVVPAIHALSAVNFGSVFCTLLFLNLALVAASFFLAAICGTCQSTALSVFLIIGMICASSAPVIGVSVSIGYSYAALASLDTYSHPTGPAGGAFWLYGSTERFNVDYNDIFDPDTGEYGRGETTYRQCEVPLVSYDQSRSYKSQNERDNVPKEDIFQGCYIIAGVSSAHTGVSSFFWYLLPQSHFLAAWSNILGYTSLPGTGNSFSFAEASQSPEVLATESLANYKRDSGETVYDPKNVQRSLEAIYDPNNTNGTSLFPQGSIIVTEAYYDWTIRYNNNDEPKSTCPSSEVSNLCGEYSSECHNPKLGYPSTGSSSVNDIIGYLTSLIVIYSLLAAYWSSVFPMGNGAAMKFYFPFQLKYWCANRGSSEGDGEDEGVRAVNVSKSYGNVEALKPFSLTMKSGEVTAILGHNGAGKSTFVNLLCCDQNSTNGDILVHGHSVASEQYAIRKMTGECKQDDILWPNLTAREHLELFGGIRGVSKEDMASTVQQWLESVDLDNVQHMRAGAFSGGMKRRLSVALATIGDASIVVLDEPTTGMDPVSRRFVWKHISDIKTGRVILLTTHAMEEADLLSDHVAIMSQGKLAAFGSPLELKTKHGSALQFSLISEKEDVKVVEEAVKNAFADSLSYVEFDASDSGYSTLTIKKVCKDQEGPRGELPLSEPEPSMSATAPTPFGASPLVHVVAVPVLKEDTTHNTTAAPALLIDTATLPEGVTVTALSAFIGFCEGENSPVKEFGISNASLEEVFLAVTHHAGTSATAQHINENRTGCCCCRKRQPKTSSEVDNNIESINAAPNPQNISQLPKVNISNYSRKLSVKMQTKAIVRFFFARSWTGRPSIVNWTIFSIFSAVGVIIGLAMATTWPDPISVWAMLIVPVCLLSFMLISIISPIYSDRNNGLFKMLSTQSMLEQSFLLGTSLYSLMVEFVYSFVFLTLFFGSTIFRTASTPDCESSASSSSNGDDYYTSYDYNCGYAHFGDKPVVSPYSRQQVLSGIYDGDEVSVYAHSASGGYSMILGIILTFSLTFPGAVLSSAFLPGFKLSLVGVSLVLLAACVSPVILYATNAIDPYQRFLGNCTEYIQSEDLLSAFTLDNVNGDFVELVGFGKIADPFIYCTPAYAAILPQMGLFQTLALTLQSDIVFYSEPEEYAEQFITKLVEGGASCSGNHCKFEYARQLYGQNLGWMVLGAILLLIFGVGIATVMIYPTACMIRARHAVGTLFNCREKKQNNSTNSEEIEEMTEVYAERQDVHAIMQPFLVGPVDVEANDSPAPILSYSSRNRNGDQLPPVVMHKLRKVFPPVGNAPKKIALKSLDLHVPKGEVLGLLGKNGAGKTTALKILAGMHDASSGIGLISGYDVETERNSVYERLGNCPQFDCVWKDQSVQRHLEFYARLKGIENPTKAAHDIANAVGLGAPDVYSRPSGNLSGGMRRRLSIAVSLIGSPDTLLLDEPTTGLDPSTRNEIWSLVSSFATPERAIIITTHMMLEADNLCSRIAIVAKGCLKVIGTQQHLKDNYGSGYLLQLNLTHDNEQSINSLLQFVKANIHEDAKIATKQAKTIHINLPRDVNIQKIFTTLYSDSAAEAMINQFLISQSSLEDVFLALGE